MRKRYTAAFKAQVVQELLRGEKRIAQIAAAHKVHPNMLSQWKATAIKGLPTLFDERRRPRRSRPSSRNSLVRSGAFPRKWHG